MKSFLCACLAASMILAGCVITPAPSLQTPSGKPEVTIHGAAKKETIDALANEMLTNGYNIREINDYAAVFTKRYTSSSYKDGNWTRIPKERRVTFNAVDTPQGVRVVATMEVFTHPGKPMEKISEIRRGNNIIKLQETLERVKDLLSK